VSIILGFSKLVIFVMCIKLMAMHLLGSKRLCVFIGTRLPRRCLAMRVSIILGFSKLVVFVMYVRCAWVYV
jgi:hypothetical protein